MADIVQKALEELLPAFEYLEKFKLLSALEIKRVIAKCKFFEYKLIKQSKEKASFTDYIQYLIDLINLIHCRRRSLKFKDGRNDIELNINKRIESLFNVICKRYSSDIDLWISRINYAKTKKLDYAISKIYRQVLKVHSENEDLWISAAKHQFEHETNVDKARNLLQRGIRFNPQSKKLWLELFRLELLFIDKIIKRKDLLEANTSEALENEDSILKGKIAVLVFRQAVKSIVDASFCLEFNKICRTIPVECSQHLTDKIESYLKHKVPDSEEKYECLVRLQSDKYLQSNETVEVGNFEEHCYQTFEEACEKFPTRNMYSSYFHFLLDRYKKARTEENFEFLQFKFESVSQTKSGVISEDLYKEWADLCSGASKRKLALQYAVESFPKSCSLWLYYVQTLIESGDESKKGIFEAFNKAFDQVVEKESLPLWMFAFEWCLIEDPNRVEKLFEASFLRDSGVSCPMKCISLEYVFTLNGIDAVRKTFKRLCLMKPNTWEFYQTYVRIENSCLKKDEKCIRNCFEQAVFDLGADCVDVWCAYLQFESGSDPVRATQVYSRATATLRNSNLVDELLRRNAVCRKNNT